MALRLFLSQIHPSRLKKTKIKKAKRWKQGLDQNAFKKIEGWFRQVFFIFNLVVSKLYVVKFSKLFEIYFSD